MLEGQTEFRKLGGTEKDIPARESSENEFWKVKKCGVCLGTGSNFYVGS